MLDLLEQDVDLNEPRDASLPGERYDLVCADCGASLQLRRARRARMEPFYGCSRYPDCQSALGAHADGRPKGVPGDRATRKARIRAHTVFDQLWKTDSPLGHDRISRSQAYTWMRKALDLGHAEAHIGNFNIEVCEKLVQAVFRDYPRLRTRGARLRYFDPFDGTD